MELKTEQSQVVVSDKTIKRLRVIGLPNDVVELIETWLRERYFFDWLNGSMDSFKVKCKKLLL